MMGRKSQKRNAQRNRPHEASDKVNPLPNATGKSKANLLDLDDYSLLNIMKYFGLYDLVSLRFVNTRFVPLFKKAVLDLGFDRVLATAEFIAKSPRTCEHVYKALAELTQNVHLLRIGELDTIRILRCFPEIDELDITFVPLRNVNAISLFPTFKKLFIKTENTKRPYLNALMTRFGSNLEELDCSDCPDLEFFLAPNLKQLSLNHIWLGRKKSGQFFKNNTTLSKLTITGEQFVAYGQIMNPTEIHSDFGIVKDNWRMIANIPSLKTLDWRAIGGDNLRASVLPQFNHITTVELEFYGQPLVLPVLEAFGQQVKDLNVTAELNTHRISVQAIAVIGRRFPNLEKLYYKTGDPYNLVQLLPLEKLENLTYLEVKIDNPATYLPLFKRTKSLELLRDMMIVSEKTLKVPREFTKWAEKERRNATVQMRTHDPMTDAHDVTGCVIC